MYMDVEIRGQSQMSIIPQALPLFPLRQSLIGPELTQQVRLVPGPPPPLSNAMTPALPTTPGFWGSGSSLMLATGGHSRLLSSSPQPLLLVYLWHHTGPSRVLTSGLSNQPHKQGKGQLVHSLPESLGVCSAKLQALP